MEALISPLKVVSDRRPQDFPTSTSTYTSEAPPAVVSRRQTQNAQLLLYLPRLLEITEGPGGSSANEEQQNMEVDITT